MFLLRSEVKEEKHGMCCFYKLLKIEALWLLFLKLSVLFKIK